MQIDLNMVSPILLYIYIAVIFIQLVYFWFVFSKFAFYKAKKQKDDYPPVSVVICAKDEYHNLKKYLPTILQQDYPEFEVVVVNDASEDETVFLLEDLEREYDNINVVNITQDLNFFPGKKFALSLGIKSAKHEHLLLTDADCIPASPNWIKMMAGNFSSKTEVVLGYGKYKEAKGFLNKIVRYETVMTATQYFSYALTGIPYMGVGRNLAYKKSLFLKLKGFISHYNVASGDDDLFINKASNKENTQIEIHPDSFTISDAKKTFSEWWRQKRRHLSVSRYYKFKHKFLLGLYSFSLILTLILLVVLLSFQQYTIIVLVLFGIRLLSKLLVFKKSADKLNEKKLLLISPLIEVFLLVIFPIMALMNLVFKQNKWK